MHKQPETLGQTTCAWYINAKRQTPQRQREGSYDAQWAEGSGVIAAVLQSKYSKNLFVQHLAVSLSRRCAVRARAVDAQVSLRSAAPQSGDEAH